jgi:hypothetical protein
MAGFDQAVAQQMLVSCNNSIAPNFQLLCERPAGWQLQARREQSVDYRRPEGGVHLPRLIANGGIEPDRQIQHLPFPGQSGCHKCLQVDLIATT